ncbi:MAG: photosystem II reaction center protein Ycf12 [Prochlorococcus sp. MED-G132]|nr:MAG: photosystem II reaction center protein Ycf12 [Prochlorococcus sp. MED-G132]
MDTAIRILEIFGPLGAVALAGPAIIFLCFYQRRLGL